MTAAFFEPNDLGEPMAVSIKPGQWGRCKEFGWSFGAARSNIGSRWLLLPFEDFCASYLPSGRFVEFEESPDHDIIEVSDTDPRAPKQSAQVGDYVLATKYEDGDPGDHFFIGFVSGFLPNSGRYLIVDNDGKNQRGNGFRRAEKITQEEGKLLVDSIPAICLSGKSLWWHLAKLRGESDPVDECETPEEKLVRIVGSMVIEMEHRLSNDDLKKDAVFRWKERLKYALEEYPEP